MNSYLINYDLRSPNRDYTSLIQAIKSYNYYASCLESCWYIKTDVSIENIRRHLSSTMDLNDSLLVVDFTSAAWTNLPVPVSNYLKSMI